MKFYKLKALSVGGKGNRTLRKEDNKTYPENTWEEKRADELVELGFLTKVKEDSIKVEPKSKKEPEKEKSEIKESVKVEKEESSTQKEESILDSMKEAGGEENEEKTGEETETSKDDQKKALLKEAKGLAKEKGIKAPHYLSGIEKLKTFINDNK